MYSWPSDFVRRPTILMLSFLFAVMIISNNVNNNHAELIILKKYQFFITFDNGLNNLKE